MRENKMSFFESLEQAATQSLTVGLSPFLAEKFGLDPAQVADAIREYLSRTPCPAKKALDSVKKRPLPVLPITLRPQTSGASICCFIYTRGEKSGEKCTTKIRGKNKFCSKHNPKKG